MIDTAQNLKEYKKRLKKALDNKFLRSAMGTFATAYKEAQSRIFQGVDVEGCAGRSHRARMRPCPAWKSCMRPSRPRPRPPGQGAPGRQRQKGQ